MVKWDIFRILKRNISIISNPSKEFNILKTKTLDDSLKDYLKMLFFVGILAAVYTFLFYFLRALFFDFFRNVDISYLRLLNYNLQISTATIFLAIFSGTCIFFILSILLFSFLRKYKYTDIVKIMISSLSPLLLFGWITSALFGLFLWSIVLFVIGIKTYPHSQDIYKGTIKERE